LELVSYIHLNSILAFFKKNNASTLRARWPEDRVPIPGRGRVCFSTQQRPDRLWGPLSLLSNGHRGLFLRGKAAGAWRWTLITT
jgi:hypothetical protein